MRQTTIPSQGLQRINKSSSKKMRETRKGAKRKLTTTPRSMLRTFRPSIPRKEMTTE